ncbi:MAG: AMP-binding protein, partial [Flavobacteriales bacterium]|nr:AMP-binding protein [Flavobacteriales bacterium]
MKFDFSKKDFTDLSSNQEKLAVIGDDFSLTWKQFIEQVNKLCDLFEANNLENLKYPVIIYGHKSANTMVAIYAMMKLEIPYIPIDILYPKERISKVVQISNSGLIINTTSTKLDIDNTCEIQMDQKRISFESIPITAYSKP